jgi:hypothetical protein
MQTTTAYNYILEPNGVLVPNQRQTAPQVAPPTAEDGSEQAPTELTPQVDCSENPDDPQCQTARIPEQQQPQVEEEEPQPDEDQSSDENSGGEDTEQ